MALGAGDENGDACIYACVNAVTGHLPTSVRRLCLLFFLSLLSLVLRLHGSI
jgi:hypothetical protein